MLFSEAENEHVQQAVDDAADALRPPGADHQTDLPSGLRVSWKFRSGGGGHVDCSTPEWAQLIVADLRPDARVWVGEKLVQDGWQA